MLWNPHSTAKLQFALVSAIFSPCKRIARTRAAKVPLFYWLLSLEQQMLFMELSNPSFSNKFSSSQWLPYILINTAFMHSCNKNTFPWWHDGIVELLITHPRFSGMLSMSWKDCLATKFYCLTWQKHPRVIIIIIASKFFITLVSRWLVTEVIEISRRLYLFCVLALIVKIMGTAYLWVQLMHKRLH